MSIETELGEVLAYLIGTGQTDPDVLGPLIVEQLTRRGYRISPIEAPIICDMTPDSLKRVRRALNLTTHQVAREAGVHASSVTRAEMGAATGRDVPGKIGQALVRLGARLSG